VLGSAEASDDETTDGTIAVEESVAGSGVTVMMIVVVDEVIKPSSAVDVGPIVTKRVVVVVVSVDEEDSLEFAESVIVTVTDCVSVTVTGSQVTVVSCAVDALAVSSSVVLVEDVEVDVDVDEKDEYVELDEEAALSSFSSLSVVALPNVKV
jgi:hypothetical protein